MKVKTIWFLVYWFGVEDQADVQGDIAFCSEECRTEQMEADEEMERKEKSASAKKLSQRPPSLGEVESPPRPPKTRAGSILAG
uniref:Uncharacterized protein n=1 Tax=Aegilops tauschii TaxID=37682 RepID=N1QV06_AEGTA